MTIDLMARLLEAMGGRVDRVVVSSLRENTFYAAVHVADGATRELDARPSDGINLAVRLGAAIFVDEDVRRVSMEVSSHALEQERLAAVRYDAAVFTNLTRDHLDYHGTMDAYLRSKARLADYLRPPLTPREGDPSGERGQDGPFAGQSEADADGYEDRPFRKGTVPMGEQRRLPLRTTSPVKSDRCRTGLCETSKRIRAGSLP
jgi:hypothetical protein